MKEWSYFVIQVLTKLPLFLIYQNSLFYPLQSIVSQSYLSSSTVRKTEMPQILKRSKEDSVPILPLIIENCDWQNEFFASYQALPKFGKPLNEVTDRDEVYKQIAEAFDHIAKLKQNSQALQLLENEKEARSGILK